MSREPSMLVIRKLETELRAATQWMIVRGYTWEPALGPFRYKGQWEFLGQLNQRKPLVSQRFSSTDRGGCAFAAWCVRKQPGHLYAPHAVSAAFHLPLWWTCFVYLLVSDPATTIEYPAEQVRKASALAVRLRDFAQKTETRYLELQHEKAQAAQLWAESRGLA